jgi:hypothetical protein
MPSDSSCSKLQLESGNKMLEWHGERIILKVLPDAFWRYCSRCRGSHVSLAMKNAKLFYHGYRFPAAVISCCVPWYFRIQLGLRDNEEWS